MQRMMMLAASALRMHFGDPQSVLLVVWAVVALALGAVFALIAVRSRASMPTDRVTEHGYWLRRHWLAAVTSVGVWAVGLTFFYGMPYASGAAPPTVVQVTGGQFFWSISPNRFPAGSRVRFDVTSADVNHGFSIYDPQGHLLGSVQAMPGYHNKLDLTLSQAGVYRIRCLEFCGLNHSTMQSSFRVTRS
jgi:cytochrome c oxidase subunit II